MVHDAAVRDLDGIKELKGFSSFVRGWHPTYASPTIMLMGVNCPIRIGAATVMPGDVVLGKDDGVMFIPAHLVEKVVRTGELVALRDRFGARLGASGRGVQAISLDVSAVVAGEGGAQVKPGAGHGTCCAGALHERSQSIHLRPD